MVSVFPSTTAPFVHQQPGTQEETMEDTLENKFCKPILITGLSPQDGSSQVHLLPPLFG